MVDFISSAADETILILVEDCSAAAATEDKLELISSAAAATETARANCYNLTTQLHFCKWLHYAAACSTTAAAKPAGLCDTACARTQPALHIKSSSSLAAK